MRPASSCLASLGVLVVACSSSPPATDSATTSDITHSAGGSGQAGQGGAGGETHAGGEAPTGELVGGVKRYDLALDLGTRALTSTLGVEVGAPGGDCFLVPCEPKASAVTWNGATAGSFTADGASLHACGTGLAPGSTLALGASTVVPDVKVFGYKLDVGFSTRKDKYGGTFTYLLSWVGGCSHFGPCDADPSRLVELHLDVKHDGPGASLCAGKRTEVAGGAHCDVAGTLAPTYSAFFAAHDTLWQRAAFAKAAGVDVVFYEPPGGEVAKALDPASTEAFLLWITALLGPFPYGSELRFATAPTAWLGFEHPANILLSESLTSVGGAYAAPAAHVTMHEIVHQWAGDRSTIATAQDFVWKEATAEYLTYVFEDEHRPVGEAAASLAYWDAISLQSGHYPRPTDDPPPEVQTFYGDVYGPGPMVLYVQLESLFGRDAVLGAIKDFLATPGARSVEELRAALEKTTGADLGAYFEAWVFGKGAPEWPTLTVTADQVGDAVTVTVTQGSPSGTLYGCAVDVELQGASSSALAHLSFGPAPKSASATATVKLAEPVLKTTLDPAHRLVAHALGAPKVSLPKRRVYVL